MTGLLQTGRCRATAGRAARERGRHRRWAPAVLLALTALAAGCGAPDPTSGAERALTEEEFIGIVVALREAERAVAQDDSAGALFEERKAEILARRGVTEGELRAFVTRRGADVAALQSVWDTIAERLRRRPDPTDSTADSMETEPRPPPDGADIPLPRREPDGEPLREEPAV